MVDEMFGCPGIEMPSATDTLQITEKALAIASTL